MRGTYRLEEGILQRGKEARARTFSESGTMALGVELAQLLVAGDVVAIYGELGAGKTRLIQGICEGLGVRTDVTSPSFTIINEYDGRMPVYHFDFYRLEDPVEIAALGLEEYIEGEGVCLIEWAERALDFLPDERLDVTIRMFPDAGRENERLIELSWPKQV